ncbi:MAG: ABC transporter ATP-binding protein [Oscillospiraceae bacterium]|jgi:ABC-2 type transport system ATP-binding protein|nr:ABC transporter ATP-binding protein [Oscillospiraceae bacterium]
MVKIENLTKYYGIFKAVNNISFEIPDNEIIGFLGPNGAGKSTTMNIITGFLPATSGNVTVEGYNIQSQPKAAKRQIGYLPEFPPLYQDMKVKEYLKFVAGIKEVNRYMVKKQIADVMEQLKITDRADQIIKSLSKGFKQRVGFAQALLGSPKILILDEPTVGLDPSQIIEVRALIKELKKTHSVILSTHILQEVEAVCDRVIIIAEGEIRANNTMEELTSMAGKNPVITISVDGARTPVVNLIKSAEGFISLINIEQIEHNVYEYKIEVKGENTRKDLLKKLVIADFNVRQVSIETANLEEIFVKLSSPKEKKSNIQKLRDIAKEYEETEEDTNA